MRRRVMGVFVLSVCLFAPLASCSYDTVHNFRLPQLSIPNMEYLSGLSHLTSATERVGGITLFTQADSPEPWALLNLNETLRMVRLDGSNGRDIITDSACLGDPAVTRDGNLAACLGSSDTGEIAVEMATLDENRPQRHWEVTLGQSANDEYYNPAWSPDGNYFALLTRGSVVNCSIVVYKVTNDGTALNLVLTLTTRDPNALSCTEQSGLAWSHDGARLLIVSQPQGLLMENDQIPVAQLLQEGKSTGDIPSAAFAPLNVGPSSSHSVWNPRDDTLALSEENTPGEKAQVERMEYVAADRTYAVKGWFSFPDSRYEATDLAWTPDGNQLLLVIGGQICTDCGQYEIQDLYLYTPPAGAA